LVPKSSGSVRDHALLLELESVERLVRTETFPFLGAFQLLEQTAHPDHRKIYGQVQYDLEGGESLHVALNKFPKLFPDYLIKVVDVVETSGDFRQHMHVVLARVVAYMRWEFLRVEVPVEFELPQPV
jgi:hypothetical protein